MWSLSYGESAVEPILGQKYERVENCREEVDKMPPCEMFIYLVLPPLSFPPSLIFFSLFF